MAAVSSLALFAPLVILLLFGLVMAENNYHNTDIYEVFKSITKIVGYLTENHQHANLDTAACLWMTYSVLKGLTPRVLNDDVRRKLEKLRDDTFRGVQQASDAAESDDEEYFEDFKYMLSLPMWDFYEETRTLDQHLTPLQVLPVKNWTPRLTEEVSDKCLKDMLEHAENADSSTLSDECLDVMTSASESTGFALTHQALYFITGLRLNFWTKDSVIPELTELTVDGRLQLQCQQIFAQAEQLYQKKENLNHGLKDLFIEQGVICGLLGFKEFFPDNWLHLLLSWEDPKIGCIIRKNDEEPGSVLLSLFGSLTFGEAEDRYDKEMPYGCSGHASGLLAARMSLQLRYMMENQCMLNTQID